MRNLSVKSIFNYDIPALCSIIEFSSDYSSEVVICSKIILDEKGFNSPKIEQKFSSFKIKNNITENEIKVFTENLWKNYSELNTGKATLATKQMSTEGKDNEDILWESQSKNLLKETGFNYIEEAGEMLKLIGSMTLCGIILAVFSFFFIGHIPPKDVSTFSIIISIIQFIFVLVAIRGFFGAGNALIKYSKSKNKKE
jgi:hypothetical protein